MQSRTFIMTLAKVMIAAAWADGSLDPSEINALKDLLYNFPNLTDDEWTILNLYIDAPVGSGEAQALVDELFGLIHSEDDKEFVISALQRLFEADGVVTDEEQKLFSDIENAIANKETGFFNTLGSLLGRAVTRRSSSYHSGSQREERIDDYIRNNIYFKFVTALEASGLNIELPDQYIRKLCLAAGLMARVASVDERITNDEKEAIQHIIMDTWQIPRAPAQLVADISSSSIAQGIDFYRLSRSFYEMTTKEERKTFLKSLFLVANSSGDTTNREIEEIRQIAEHLHLEHKDFIEAKLSISDEDRGGL